MTPPNRLGATMMASLFERRTLMLSGLLDESTATEVCTALVALDGMGDEHIDLLIRCSDGTVEAALMLIDLLDVLGVPVHAKASGLVGGGALGVLAAASERSISPSASLRVSRPTRSTSSTSLDVETLAAQYETQFDAYMDRLVSDSDKERDELEEAMRSGRFLDAQEAVRWGLVDAISA